MLSRIVERGLYCLNPWRLLAARPQGIQFEALHDGFGDLQDDRASSPHDLCSHVYQPTAYRRGIAGDGQDILEVVFLESLKQKEGDHHQIIESLVGSEPLEWHLLGSKFFQSAVGQFIGAPLMVVIDQALVI